MDWEIDDGASTTAVRLERRGDGWSARIGTRACRIDIIESSPTSVNCALGNHHVVQADCRWDGDTCHLVIDHVPFMLVVRRSSFAGKKRTTNDQRRSYDIKAPMPARVVDVRVAPGDRVTKGTPVMVLEAMKMQNEIVAPAAGVVRTVHITAGQPVEGNQILVTFAAE